MNDGMAFDPILILSRILRRTATHLGTSHGFIGVSDSVHHGVFIELGIGMGENYLGHLIQPHEGVTGAVLRTGHPHLITQYQQWEQKYQGILPRNQSRIGTVAGAPVVVQNAIVAVLVFLFEVEGLLNESEILEQVRQAGEHAGAVLSDLSTLNPLPPLIMLPPDTPMDLPSGAGL